MLQYLFNSSAIWLISLIVFDVFLRRESFHTYNRFYLLSTFLLGLVLPMVQWHGYEYLQPALQRPVENIAVAKTAIATTTTSATIDWQLWIGVGYIAGACAALTLLMIDIAKLTSYYALGTKSKYGEWTIVATGKEHAPFSFRKLLFVNTREQYSPDEWDMLFVHEREHTRQLHIADLLLMQLARVVLWFHPLVYVYTQRLLLVHEYQADNVPAVQPAAYGQFLVEQAILTAAPSLSHSFNRSPIKKRIIMLTRRSTNASKTRMLVFIPLALVSIFCFSQNGYSQKFERKGNVVTYRGNKFQFSAEKRDTVELEDPVTGEKITKIMIVDAQPQSMNGKPIPGRNDFTDQPAYEGKYKNLRGYIIAKVKPQLQQLENGQYKLDIDNVVIDEKGKIVYFDYRDMRRSKMISDNRILHTQNQIDTEVIRDPGANVSISGSSQQFALRTSDANTTAIDKNSQQKIFEHVCKAMDEAAVYRPALKDGKPTIAVMKPMEFMNKFKVENHKLYDMDKTGKWIEL